MTCLSVEPEPSEQQLDVGGHLLFLHAPACLLMARGSGRCSMRFPVQDLLLLRAARRTNSWLCTAHGPVLALQDETCHATHVQHVVNLACIRLSRGKILFYKCVRCKEAEKDKDKHLSIMHAELPWSLAVQPGYDCCVYVRLLWAAVTAQAESVPQSMPG